MVKVNVCNPPIYGLTVATQVGGIKTQTSGKDVAIPVEYDRKDIETSLWVEFLLFYYSIYRNLIT